MLKFIRLIKLILVLGALLVPASFAQDYTEYVERDDDSDVVSVSDQNERMNAAMDKAFETLEVFFTALDSGQYPRDTFMLKILTETAPEEYEHMWYVFIEFTEDDQISGLLAHNPFAANSDYEEGGVYSLPLSMISDWRFLDGDKLRGDFTTRVILDFMAEDDPEGVAAGRADYHDDPLP